MSNPPHRVEIDSDHASGCDAYNAFGVAVLNCKQYPELTKDAYQHSYEAVIPPFGNVTVQWADPFYSLEKISEYILKHRPGVHVGLTKDFYIALATFRCFDVMGWIRTDGVWHDLHLVRVSFAMTAKGDRIVDWVSPI